MFAALVRSDVWELDQGEGEKLARAAANVIRHYENIPGISPKLKDWIMAIQCGATIYGPRLAAARMEAAARRARNVTPPRHMAAPANVAPAANSRDAFADAARNNPPQPQSKSPLPPNVMNTSQPAPRNQPGLEKMDGADLPLKLN